MNPTGKVTITRKNADGQFEQAEVRLMYCLAAEIGFQNESKKTIDVFVPEFEEKDGKTVVKGMPPATDEDYIILALACITAAYEETEEKSPVNSATLLYHASRQEVVALVAEVMKLRNEWLQVPDTIMPEMAEKKGKGKRKNA